MKQHDLDSIRKIHKKGKIKKGKYAAIKFIDAIFDLLDAYDIVIANGKRVETLNQGRKNCVVNLVTAMEVYFKKLIIEHSGKWNSKGLQTLLNEQGNISLPQAVELFKNMKVNEEHVIVHYSKFQNIHNIQNTFSKLTGSSDFLKTIGEFDGGRKLALTSPFKAKDIEEQEFNGTHRVLLNSTVPDWNKHLNELFELRNRIVHENDNNPIEKTKIKLYSDLCYYFIQVIDEYCVNRNFETNTIQRPYRFNL